MRYEKDLFISSEEMDWINKILHKAPVGAPEFGKEVTSIFTVFFHKDIFLEVKICGMKYEDEKYNLTWTEAVLFKDGVEISHTDPGEEIEGEWILYEGEDEFIVNVKKTPVRAVTLCFFKDSGKYYNKIKRLYPSEWLVYEITDYIRTTETFYMGMSIILMFGPNDKISFPYLIYENTRKPYGMRNLPVCFGKAPCRKVSECPFCCGASCLKENERQHAMECGVPEDFCNENGGKQ